VSVRVGSCRARALEVLRFAPVRVKTRLRVMRFVSHASEICLRVMRVGFCVSLHVMRVARHACRVSFVSTLLSVIRVACHGCLDRLRFGSCPCQVLACLRFVFVFVLPC
jgi:hypothetical protein